MAIMVGTWWYWVSMGRYWLVHCATGSLSGCTCWYLVGTRRYWLVLGGTGSVWGGNGWDLMVLGQYNSILLSIKERGQKKNGIMWEKFPNLGGVGGWGSDPNHFLMSTYQVIFGMPK